MIKIEYSKSKNLFYLKRFGTITLQEVLDVIDELILNEKHHNQNIYLLEENQESSLGYSANDHNKMADKISFFLPLYKEVYHAFIVTKPYETAISFLFEKLSDKKANYYFKTFSTKESALAWLNKG